MSVNRVTTGLRKPTGKYALPEYLFQETEGYTIAAIQALRSKMVESSRTWRYSY